jgi:probable F420-dependent oxidoreductase
LDLMSGAGIRIGVVANTDRLLASPTLGRAYCETLEAAGVESVWAVEHIVVAQRYGHFPYSADGRMRSAPDRPRPDPIDLLAWLAAQSSTLLLGTGVVIAPLHNPAQLAKRAATVDVLSSGRMLLGVGIGWQREEYSALGVPFADRGARLEDYVEAMRSLWREEPSSYQGRYVRYDGIFCRPRPHADTIPVIIGGNNPRAVARAGRAGDGWFPFAMGPEEFASGARSIAAATSGRPFDITAWPGSASRSQQFDPAFVQRYVDGGATRIIFDPELDAADPVASLAGELARYRREVTGKLRPAPSGAVISGLPGGGRVS